MSDPERCDQQLPSSDEDASYSLGSITRNVQPPPVSVSSSSVASSSSQSRFTIESPTPSPGVGRGGAPYDCVGKVGASSICDKPLSWALATSASCEVCVAS